MGEHSSKGDITSEASAECQQDTADDRSMTRTVVPAPLMGQVQVTYPIQPPNRFIVAAVLPLPRVDLSITLGTSLIGRGSDTSCNEKLLLMATKRNTWIYVFAVLGSFGCWTMMYAQSETLGSALSIMTFMLMAPINGLLVVVLVRDLIQLNAQTFEFWFLIAMDSIGTMFLSSALTDHRCWAYVAMALLCVAIVCLDGNVYTRRFLFRLTALAPIGVVCGLLPCVLRYTPRLDVSRVTLGNGHVVDSVDVVLHCYSTLGIFMLSKVFRSRHLVWPSSEPIKTIQCEIYFPLCHLVPMPSRQTLSNARHRSQAKSGLLEFVVHDLPGVIHSNDLLVSSQWIYRLGSLVSAIGYVGVLSGWIGFCWYVAKGRAMCSPSTPQVALAVVSFAASPICFVFSLARAQRTLLRRLFWSLDAWFVSFQITIVSIAVSDVLYWDQRILFIWSAWIWCHWCMLGDTFAPVSRQRLNFDRFLTLIVHLGLIVYPVILMYWIFYSNAAQIRNRVFFQTTIFKAPIKMEAYSMLVSRIMTIWLWMGRFLWRELFYPPGAFKLLKYRVQYHIPQGDVLLPSN